MRFAFIINSQSPQSAADARKLQSMFGDEHSYLITQVAGEATVLSQQAVDYGYTHIIAVGGDGTINEVVNGMMASAKYAETKPFFTILPRGSGNDFARSLGISKQLNHLRERLNSTDVCSIDIGLVEFKDLNGNDCSRYFINVMDAGLGGHVAQKVSQYKRGLWSFTAYQRAILTTLPFYNKKTATLNSENYRHSGPVLSVVVANGRWFGNGLCISPDASLRDGALQLVVLGDVGILEYLLYLPRVLREKKIKHKAVVYKSIKSVIIDGINIPLQLDGEFVGYTPLKVTAVASALNVLQ